MSDLKFGDSAYPPSPYPTGLDGWAFYIGGDTPHVWTPQEVSVIPTRYRLPIFTRDNPQSHSAITDVTAAVSKLTEIGAPKGILVAWDSETSVDPAYIQLVYGYLYAAGYTLLDYGSLSTVFGNKNPDGYYWAAHWTNLPHDEPGAVMTQWTAKGAYDESNAQATLPFWDTQPPTVIPPLPTTTWQQTAKSLDVSLNHYLGVAADFETRLYSLLATFPTPPPGMSEAMWAADVETVRGALNHYLGVALDYDRKLYAILQAKL